MCCRLNATVCPACQCNSGNSDLIILEFFNNNSSAWSSPSSQSLNKLLQLKLRKPLLNNKRTVPPRYVFSSSDDFSIKMWQINQDILSQIKLDQQVQQEQTMKKNYPQRILTELKTFSGHISSVHCSLINVNYGNTFSSKEDSQQLLQAATLVSCCRRDDIRTWNLQTGECTTHPCNTISMEICLAWWFNKETKKRYLIHTGKPIDNAASYTIYLREWNQDFNQHLQVVKVLGFERNNVGELEEGHTKTIRSLLVDEDTNTLFSCSNDYTIIQWCLNSGKVIKKFDDNQHSKSVLTIRKLKFGYSATSFHNVLVSAGDDYSLVFWNINTGKCLLNVANAHSNSIYSMVHTNYGCATSNEWKLVTVSRDDYIKIWRIELATTVQEEENSNNYTIKCKELKYIPSPFDCTMTTVEFINQSAEDKYDGTVALVGDFYNNMFTIDITTFKVIDKYAKAHNGTVRHFALL